MINRLKEILKEAKEMWGEDEETGYDCADIANFLMVELEEIIKENE